MGTVRECKETGEINCNNRFHLTHYIQNSIMPAGNRCKIIRAIVYILPSQSVCVLHTHCTSHQDLLCVQCSVASRMCWGLLDVQVWGMHPSLSLAVAERGEIEGGKVWTRTFLFFFKSFASLL